MNAVITEHKLDFESADWHRDPKAKRFRVGTCEGIYYVTKNSLDILAITNNSPGNGHLNDVFEWFEYSCREYKLKFRILEVWNLRFKKYLIEKRGFTPHGREHVIKEIKNRNRISSVPVYE